MNLHSPAVSPSLLRWVALLCTALLTASCSNAPGASPSGRGDERSRPRVVNVPGDVGSIQDAVDRVAPGGLVLVAPGTYLESVVVRTRDVTVRGTDRNRVVIDGEGVRPYGVVGIADGIRVQNLSVLRHTFYGVLVTGLHDSNGPRANNDDGYENFDPEKFPPLQRFEVDHVTAANNGLYGIYAFNAQHGVLTDNYASGSADSGFYVGQCRACDILVSGNLAERNAVGFENANASGPLMVTGNRFSSNRVGMTFLSDYQEAFIPQRGDVIAGNLILGNTEAATPAQADGGFGIGIGIGGGTENTFVANRIEGHPRSAVVVSNNSDLPARGNRFERNVYVANRVDFSDTSSARVAGIGNCPEASVTRLPARAAARCTPTTRGTSVTATSLSARTPAPPGISFLDVVAPGALPQGESSSSVPDRLPDTVSMPDPAGLRPPDRSFLQVLARAAAGGRQ